MLLRLFWRKRALSLPSSQTVCVSHSCLACFFSVRSGSASGASQCSLISALWKGRQCCPPLELPPQHPSCSSAISREGRLLCSTNKCSVQTFCRTGLCLCLCLKLPVPSPVPLFLSKIYTFLLNNTFPGEPILQEFSPVQNPRALNSPNYSFSTFNIVQHNVLLFLFFPSL